MPASDSQQKLRTLVMTRGHPFNRDDFFAMFDAMSTVASCAIEQPACQLFFEPRHAADYDAFILYDMPGLDFLADDAPQFLEPPEKFRNDFLDLLEIGPGFVFLHHAIAAWPAWPEYADIVGGKFLYRAGEVRGHCFPDSGYRHEVTHTLTAQGAHPVLTGLPESFTLTDELYLSHVFEQDVIPLLRSDYAFRDTNFYSASQAVGGSMFSRENWTHPTGSNLVAWAKHYRNSPIVYLQSGDSKSAYDNPMFRKLLLNAINWVSSAEARRWARQRNTRRQSPEPAA